MDVSKKVGAGVVGQVRRFRARFVQQGEQRWGRCSRNRRLSARWLKKRGDGASGSTDR
jgi:hypothetical protein